MNIPFSRRVKRTLATVPFVSDISDGSLTATWEIIFHAILRPGGVLDGWRLVTITGINGVTTAVFEKHVTHRGAIAYVTERGGTIARIPKHIGSLAKICPRPTNTPGGVKLLRAPRYIPGPDVTGDLSAALIGRPLL